MFIIINSDNEEVYHEEKLKHTNLPEIIAIIFMEHTHTHTNASIFVERILLHPSYFFKLVIYMDIFPWNE